MKEENKKNQENAIKVTSFSKIIHVYLYTHDYKEKRDLLLFGRLLFLKRCGITTK